MPNSKMGPGDYKCLDCGEIFTNDTCFDVDPRIFKHQAILHAYETGHSNFQLLETNIKVKIKNFKLID